MRVEDYVTLSEAAAMLGCNLRALQRAMSRCPRDDIYVRIYGRRMIIKVAVPVLKDYWYRRGSAAAARQAKIDGAKGGTKKGENRRAAENGDSGKAP